MAKRVLGLLSLVAALGLFQGPAAQAQDEGGRHGTTPHLPLVGRSARATCRVGVNSNVHDTFCPSDSLFLTPPRPSCVRAVLDGLDA